MNPIIKVKSLKKNYRVKEKAGFLKTLFNPKYKTVHAVDGVDFEIKQGEAVAFLGPNGAGKTTAIKMMTGLIYPTGGIVDVLGYNPFQRNPDFLKRIGLVMGNKASLHWDLTPKQSFNLIKRIYDIDPVIAEKRINELAELLDAKKLLDTPIRNLSLGERMKMELIGSILHNPEILFLDEPTIGLDILTKKRVRHFLRDIQKKEKTTLLLTSHDIDDIEAVCDRVIVINKGKKYYDDSINSLMRKYQKNRYLRFVLDSNLNKDQLKEISKWGKQEEKLDKSESNPAEAVYFFKASIENMVPLISKVLSMSTVLDMQIESVPLEDIIADLFREK